MARTDIVSKSFILQRLARRLGAESMATLSLSGRLSAKRRKPVSIKP